MIKKILYYSIIVAITQAGLTACNDFLETSSPSSSSVDATFTSPTDTYNALMGIYGLLCEDAMYSSRMNLFWQTNTDIEITSLSSNDYRNADRRGLSSYGSHPSVDIPDVTNPYNTIYRAIERLNLAIVNIPNSPAASGDTRDVMMAMYGEALTIRALLYMELCRQFGDVPFRTEPASEKTFYVKRTNRDEIYEYILGDLNEAAKYLPWAGQSGYTVERITKGFAFGLTARIAMYRAGYSLRSDGTTQQGTEPEKYYQIAKNACLKLTESESPHDLLPDFHQYFINQCQNIVDNTESLFEVALGIDKSGEVGYANGTRFEGAGWKYSGVQTQGYVNTTPVFLYSFDPSDTRRDVTVDIYTYKEGAIADSDDGPVGKRQKIVTNPNAFRVGKWSLKYLTGAALAVSAAATAKVANGINWPVMRMADAYLLLAESEYRLNGATDIAKNALKKVRNRAFASTDRAVKVEQYVDALSGEAFFDALVEERAWELAGEAVRKYDLVRWNLLPTKLQQFKDENIALVENGVLPDRYQRAGQSIPSIVYYKYDMTQDYPEIDMSTINLYTSLGAKPDNDYYQYRWLPLTGSTLTSYKEWINEYVNYGYNPAVNNHLFAFPSDVISTAGGLWDNDSYWANVVGN